MALVFQYWLVSHLPGSTTTTANASSGGGSFSPDGRWVLFDSTASNLAGSDSNGGSDLFVYDILDFSVDLVSHTSGSTTTAANAPTDAARAVFASDSRYVLFASDASDVAGTDSNGVGDLFLYDTQNGGIALVSHIPFSTTTTGNGSTDGGAFLSSDGHWVLFDSNASDLASGGDANGSTDVFLYNTLSASVTLVSHASGLSSTANGESTSLAFSPEGNNLLFASRATNLLSTSINPNRDSNLFLFSPENQFPFAAGQTTLVSHTASSLTTSANNSSAVNVATFSPDGRYVVFDSLATNLVANQVDTNGVADLFLYDTLNSSSVLVSHIPGSTITAGSGGTSGTYPGGAIFSPNGRYVLFKSDASNLVANQADTNGAADLFVYDTQNASIALVSHIPGSTTTTPNAASGVSTMTFSPDGRYVLFDSSATTLAGADVNTGLDLFLYDTQDASVDLVSHAAGSATTTGNAGSSTVAQPFSQDSRYVLFNSPASNLVASDGNGAEDAFLYDTLDGSVLLVSAAAGGAAASGTSIATGFGPDGTSVLLKSDATNLRGLALTDLNNASDVFLATLADVNLADDDFNGDLNSDILWRHDSGQVYIWEMNGLQLKAEGTVQHAAVPNDWHIEDLGDFNGDANSDILWRHDSGQVYIWEMDGLGIKAEGAAAHAFVPTDWHIESTADFNGDLNSDILWRHDSGQVYIWEMNGLGTTAEGAVAHAAVPNDWHVQHTGDFDGDGKSDILWRHDSGQVYFWEMDGLAIKAEGAPAHAPVPTAWHIEGIGDFDGDLKSDILWRHDSGQVYIWEMDGVNVKTEGTIAHAGVPTDWHVQDIGDYNADGKSDILWRHDSGQVYLWEMNGLQLTAEGAVAHAPVPSDWHILSA